MTQSYIYYLDEVVRLREMGEMDRAWRTANVAVIKLKDGVEMGLMYYQMSLIRVKEKKYVHALSLMGMCTALLGKLGGITHKRHIEFLLRKVNRDGELNEFLKLSKDNLRDVFINLDNWAKEKQS